MCVYVRVCGEGGAAVAEVNLIHSFPQEKVLYNIVVLMQGDVSLENPCHNTKPCTEILNQNSSHILTLGPDQSTCFLAAL